MSYFLLAGVHPRGKSQQGSGGTRLNPFSRARIGVGPRPDSSSSEPILATEGPGPVVLLIDDDVVFREVTAHVLEDAGLKVVEAGSAEEALEVIESGCVDAIVVDQLMPGVSGIELTRRAKARIDGRTTPLLFVSADDSPEVRLGALDAGATDFILKPVDPDELVARLNAQLRLAGYWESKLDALRLRAQTVSDIASLRTADLTAASRAICRHIEAVHGGEAAIVWWPRPQIVPVVLAHAPTRLVPSSLSALKSLRPRAAPWIHDWSSSSTRPDSDQQWWACAPLRLGRRTAGLLAVRGMGMSPDEALSTVVEYAMVSSLKLGPALSETIQVERYREDVEEVVGNEAFEPLFQPVVDLRSASVVGYEALTRLDSGRPIVELLEIADLAQMRPGLEVRLLEAILEDAAALPEGLWLSVNLSPSVLLDHGTGLAALLSGTDRQVVVELTENERIEDYPAVCEALGALGDGVSLAVDDTGSGYASLRHVVSLKPEYLKLDRGWIAGLEADETRQALISGIVTFCEHTDTELIAEGIERPAELEILQALGVTYGQGYLLGRPGREGIPT